MTFTILDKSLPVGQVNQPYSFTLAATGGTKPYIWSCLLPEGLLIDSASGAIQGTVKTVIAQTVLVKVKDSGSPPMSSTAYLQLTVKAETLAIKTSNLPAGEVGQVYFTNILAVGGQTPYTFSILSGILPLGLIFDGSGTISGVPSSGSSTLVFGVTDFLGVQSQKNLTISVASPVVITSKSLITGITGSPYMATISVSGGQAPFLFSIVSGALPSGITMSPFGVISGICTSVATAVFVVSVTDALSASATGNLSLIVESKPIIITTSLPPAVIDTAYSFKITACGGHEPYTWSLPSGGPDFSISQTGELTGTPKQQNAYSMIVKIIDGLGVIATADLSLNVKPLGQWSSLYTDKNLTQSTAMSLIDGTFVMVSGLQGGLPRAWSSGDGRAWKNIDSTPLNKVIVALAMTSGAGKVWLSGSGWNDSLGYIYSFDPQSGKWYLVTNSAPFGRTGMSALVWFNNQLWAISSSANLAQSSNQVWSSSDGVTWHQQPSPPWSSRTYVGAAALHGRLWICGGQQGWHSPNVETDDIWSTADGLNWRQEGPPPWAGQKDVCGITLIPTATHFYAITANGDILASQSLFLWTMRPDGTWSDINSDTGFSINNGYPVGFVATDEQVIGASGYQSQVRMYTPN